MTVPLTYATLETELLVALVQAPPPYNVIPPDFASLYPNAVSYAESRICAEIPLLANRTQNVQLTTTSGSRTIDLTGMSNPLVVMERLALVMPSGQASPALGTRYQYVKTTLDFINAFWPHEATTLAPSAAEWIGRYWAPVNTAGKTGQPTSSIVAIAPTPDASYTAECTGLFQPVSLATNTAGTYLSTVYPDLLMAGCMVFLEGALMRNFGAQSSDPAQAMSWEGIYQGLKSACEFEEQRRRGLAADVPRQAQAPA